jgi:hypothetical protein
MINFSQRFTRILRFIPSFFVGVILAIGLSVVVPLDSYMAIRRGIGLLVTNQETVFVKKQAKNSQYIVPFIRRVTPGYLLIIPADVFGTPSDSYLGNSRLLTPGIYTNESIAIDDWKGATDIYVCQYGDDTPNWTLLADRWNTPLCVKTSVY